MVPKTKAKYARRENKLDFTPKERTITATLNLVGNTLGLPYVVSQVSGAHTHTMSCAFNVEIEVLQILQNCTWYCYDVSERRLPLTHCVIHRKKRISVKPIAILDTDLKK